jgi:DNA polymerase-3 subunit chi
MTNISFYVLKGDTEYDRQVFACRLASKAYHQGKHIYIHTQDAEQAEQFNQLLWSFRADSFIPHQLVDTNNESPVLIGHDASPPRLMDLLINLSTEQPLFFSQFDRVAECINDNDEIKAAGRQRYQFYQQRGYQLSSHKL